MKTICQNIVFEFDTYRFEFTYLPLYHAVSYKYCCFNKNQNMPTQLYMSKTYFKGVTRVDICT